MIDTIQRILTLSDEDYLIHNFDDVFEDCGLLDRIAVIRCEVSENHGVSLDSQDALGNKVIQLMVQALERLTGKVVDIRDITKEEIAHQEKMMKEVHAKMFPNLTNTELMVVNNETKP